MTLLIRFKQAVTYFVLVSFFFSFLPTNSYADGATIGTINSLMTTNQSMTPTQLKLSEVAIPNKIGVIEYTFKGNSAPLFYIQDAHNSLEAQKNIAALISLLVQEYGVKTVLVEGVEGKVNLDTYFQFSDSNVKEKVSDYFLEHLRLSGAQYAHINRTQDFDLIGIDHFKTYKKNLSAYEKAAKNREVIQQDLARISKVLKSLGDRFYSKEIKEWLKLKLRVEDKKLSMGDYLFRSMKMGDFQLEQFPNLKLISTYLKQDQLSKEEASLLDKQLKQLDSDVFFNELNQFEEALINQFLTDATAKQVLRYQRIVDLLNKLNLISVTPEEYLLLKEELKEFNSEVLAKFLAAHLKKTILVKKEWEKLIKNSLEFYELARERDVFFKRQLEAINTPSILVTGGFHKEPVTNFLKKNKISHAVLAPQISRINKKYQERYDFLMSGQYYDFETSFIKQDPAVQAAQQQTLASFARDGRNVQGIVNEAIIQLFPNSQEARAASLGNDNALKIEQALSQGDITTGTMQYLYEWLKLPGDLTIQGTNVLARIQTLIDGKNWKELNDAFFQEVKPGTAGVRGELGIGSNRINVVTIGKFVEGHARHLEAVWAGKVEGKEIDTNKTEKAVILAYDPREGSYDAQAKGPGYLVKMAAAIYAAHGFKVYVFDGPAPTPELSFAVQKLGALAGAVFTASHNPKTDNGFKPYDETGQQLLGPDAEGLNQYVAEIKQFSDVKKASYDEALEKGQVEIVGPTIDEQYVSELLQYGVHIKADGKYDLEHINTDITVGFSPLHGTAGRTVPALLAERGISAENIFNVESQLKPDGTFPTAAKPNPEEDAALDLLKQLAVEKKVDVAAANDPDADRVAVLVPTSDAKEEYFLLNGNLQMAVIADYLLNQLSKKGTLPKNSVFWKSLVSSDLMMKIAEAFDIPTVESRVGFKFAGDKMKEYEKLAVAQLLLNDEEEFVAIKTKVENDGYKSLNRSERELILSRFSQVLLFGGEESYGANRGDIVRDKDGPAMIDMFVEIVGRYKKQGTTVYDRLFGAKGIFDTYGYYRETLGSYKTQGAEGNAIKQAIMTEFASNPPAEVAGKKVVAVLDFAEQTAKLPKGTLLFDGEYKSETTPGKFELENEYEVHTFNDLNGKNVGREGFVELIFEDGSRVIVRPSGTEPKIKFYALGRGEYSDREAVDVFISAAQTELAEIATKVADSFNAASLGAYSEAELEKGKAYYEGRLDTTPISRPWRPSIDADVDAIFKMDTAERLEYIALAVESLIKGKGVIGTLAAGASSRMPTSEAPEEVKELIQGREIKSKAAVPVGVLDGQVYTFLGAFLKNIERLQNQISDLARSDVRPSVLILSNQDYREELQTELDRESRYGLDESQFVVFNQELGNQYVATPEHVRNLYESGKIDKARYDQAIEISENVQKRLSDGSIEAVILEGEQTPLGHGEFFHQLISSGTFLQLVDKGHEWISVRNIDNAAATFDEDWLVTLGLFIKKGLAMQPEVSPRSPGQKGGSLIVTTDNGNHRLAEDPEIAAKGSETNLQKDYIGETSYWFNDAVAIIGTQFVVDIYKSPNQSSEEFLNELRANAENPTVLEAIAERGRSKFPTLMDPKPAKESDAISLKIETNMWQSTGVGSGAVRVEAVGVTAVKNIEQGFADLPLEDQRQKVRELRMLATKQWGNPEDPQVETYYGNKPYIELILEHIATSQFIPEGLDLSKASSLGVMTKEKRLSLLESAFNDYAALLDQPAPVVLSLDDVLNFSDTVAKEVQVLLLEGKIKVLLTGVTDRSLVPDVFNQESQNVEIISDAISANDVSKYSGFLGKGKVVHLSQSLDSPETIASRLGDAKDRFVFVKQPEKQNGVLSAALLFASGSIEYKEAFRQDASGFYVPTAIGRLMMNLFQEYVAQTIIESAA